MSPKEAHDLLVDIRADYIAMIREYNADKRLTRYVDPLSLPLVQRLDKGIHDLALAAGIQGKAKP